MPLNQASPTLKGHNLFHVASALQKAIRRCEEDQAMYWAVELYESGYGEYCWKRLRIMCSEDVGLAEPLMPATIQALYEAYADQLKKTKSTNDKNRPERLYLTHAVLLLVHAKKSRMVDWTLIAYWGEHAKDNRPIPDYAYDKHNLEGRKMGRGLDHFYAQGAALEQHEPYPGEEKMKARAYLAQKGTPSNGSDDIQNELFTQ